MLDPAMAPVAARTGPVCSKNTAGSRDVVYNANVRMTRRSFRDKTLASSPSCALTPLKSKTMQACLAIYRFIG